MSCSHQVTSLLIPNCFIRNSLLALACLLSIQSSAFANTKIDAILRTQESMQEHSSDEPRRLMHDVLTKEFAKGSVVQIVNPENAPSPVKLRSAHYHIGANLIAFSLASKAPVNVSLSMQLVKDATREVIMNSDRSLYVDESAVESGLKLHNSEFDNSQYGQALTILTRAAAKQFEMRVQQMNLSSSSQSKTTREKEPQGEVKKERRIASPF